MNQRLTLLLIWLSGYVICLGFFLVFLLNDWMLSDEFMKNFGTITTIFAPQLTTILTFWFAKKKTVTSRRSIAPSLEVPSNDAFCVALATSAIYNLVILVIVGAIFFKTGEGLIDKHVELARNVGIGMTFMVGPAIGYFFAKS